MSKKQKYYVVWQGNTPGIYNNWEECKEQVVGVSAAQYKSFESREEAEAAFHRPYDEVKGHKVASHNKECIVGVDENGMTVVKPGCVDGPILDSLAVDAACSGNPGVMEYQGVYVANRQQIFHYKAPVGTNNIGEFLAIVHGLALLKQKGITNLSIYSDSRNAMSWVAQKKCKTKLELNPKTEELFDLIHRAETWLKNNQYTTPIIKWETEKWGEIPADFGRK
jgi:ribonuclease HI